VALSEERKTQRRQPPPPPVRGELGRYHLVERLGRGGMAEVWLAEITGPGGFRRTVVVKRILPHLMEDPVFERMFLAEARLSARLSHPNIVAVHEVGEVAGQYFIAMEYVAGRDLSEVLTTARRLGPLDPGMAAAVMHETARALAYAHALVDENGAPLLIIHRDVSPSNIMISYLGAVKLVDFGLAKALAETGDDQTKSDLIKGKFGYLAPEMLRGFEPDHRVDVFAAGVVLWEAMTGRRLFKGKNDLETIGLVREARVDPPSRWNPSVVPELDRIALKALAADRDERYPSCAPLAEDLAAVMRELGWGPERLAATMGELFPDGRPPTGKFVLAAGSAVRTVRRVTDVVTNGVADRWRDLPRRWRFLSGVALVVLTTLGLFAAVPRTRTPPVQPQRPRSQPTPAAGSVAIQVASQPEGATVFLDGEKEPLGTAPMWFTLPRSRTSRTVRLTLPGYDDALAQVLPDGDAQLVVTLTPLRPKAAPQRPPPVRKPAATDLERGDLVDPYR
jgi:tRNA A-37 threonylcarbamoyl transferase component Bud32